MTHRKLSAKWELLSPRLLWAMCLFQANGKYYVFCIIILPLLNFFFENTLYLVEDTTIAYACMFLPFLNCVNMGQTWKVSRLHTSGLIIPHLKVNEAQMCVTMNECPTSLHWECQESYSNR